MVRLRFGHGRGHNRVVTIFLYVLGYVAFAVPTLALWFAAEVQSIKRSRPYSG